MFKKTLNFLLDLVIGIVCMVAGLVVMIGGGVFLGWVFDSGDTAQRNWGVGIVATILVVLMAIGLGRQVRTRKR